MKRNDIILIVVVLILGGLSYAVMNLIGKPSGSDVKVVIKHRGEVIQEIPFDEQTDEVYTMQEDDELNVVTVKDGKVAITEANCRDLVCVKTGEISEPGEIIVCLPHQFTVEIVSDENVSELDDIAE